jgi:methoxymalonate biosynthesis acyl carrier protein
MTDIEEKVRLILLEAVPHLGDLAIESQTPLLSDGIVDSLAILEIVRLIEERFHIVVEDEEMTEARFENIETIVHLLEQKCSGVV